MSLTIRCALAAAFVILTGLSTVANSSELPVDLQLVIAVDMSPSMTFAEQRFQRDGYAAALRQPAVLDAIQSGPLGRIAVTYIMWGEVQLPVVRWKLVDGPESAEALAAEIASLPPRWLLRTSISGALTFAARSFGRSGFVSARKIVDISGDGPNSAGPPVTTARDAVLADGVTINGLVIMLGKGGTSGGLKGADLEAYFHGCVVGGPGAFTMRVTRVEDFATTIERKFVREILMSGRRNGIFAVADERFPRTDCLIGERRTGRLPPLQ